MKATPEQLATLAELACRVACEVAPDDIVRWPVDAPVWEYDVKRWLVGGPAVDDPTPSIGPADQAMDRAHEAARIAVRFVAKRLMGIDVVPDAEDA